MGSFGEQSPRQILQTHGRGTPASGRRIGELEPAFRSHRARHANHMKEWLHHLRNRLHALIWRSRLDRALQQEIEFHLAERAARGHLSPAEARLRFGNPTVLKETTREMWTFRWL